MADGARSDGARDCDGVTNGDGPTGVTKGDDPTGIVIYIYTTWNNYDNGSMLMSINVDTIFICSAVV